MPGTSISLFEFGSGGGVWGDGHRLLIRSAKVVEHSFESKDRDTGITTKVWEPGCFLALDLQSLDPADPSDPKQVYQTQYYNIGNLPAARAQELGFTVDPKRVGGLGGFQPSQDNETPAVEGSFVYAQGKTKIYEFADYAVLMNAFLELGLEEHVDRLAAQGVSALDGTVFQGVAMAKPKPPGAKVKPDAKERLLLVPESVESWGWEPQQPAQPAAAPTQAAKPRATGKPKPAAAANAPAPAPAAPTPAPAAQAPVPSSASAAPANGIVTFDSATEEQRNRAIELIAEVLQKGPITHNLIAGRAFLLAKGDGPARTGLMQVINDTATAEYGASMRLWSYDAATNTLSPTQ